MSQRVCQIRVDGQQVDDLYRDLIALEVCDIHEGSSSFAIKLGIFLKNDGTWTRLDGSIGPWQRITVEAGFEGNADVLIDGYVAAVEPYIAAQESESYLLIWGYDASYAMAQEEKLVSWADKRYSEIAQEIFTAYGLSAEVEDSQVLYAETDHLLVQRGTDWAFLQRLAGRIGYEVFVRGGKGFFRPPLLNGSPQPDIAMHFGPAGTNANWFRPRLQGHLPTIVRASRITALDNMVEPFETETSPQRILGETDARTLRNGRSAAGPGVLLLPPQPVLDQQEWEARITGIRRRADWIVEAEGELDGMLYGAALKANGLVTVKGVGQQFSGVYYVCKVIHHITHEVYLQRFWLKRNAAGVVGNEDFQDVGAERPPVPQQPSGEERVATRPSGREVAP